MVLRLRIGEDVLVLAEPRNQEGAPSAVDPETTTWSSASAASLTPTLTVTETEHEPLLALVSPQQPGTDAITFEAETELGSAITAELACIVLDAVTFTFRAIGTLGNVTRVRLTGELDVPFTVEVVATARDEDGGEAVLAPGVPIEDITWSVGPEDPPVIEILAALGTHAQIHGLRPGSTTLRAAAVSAGGVTFHAELTVTVLGTVLVVLSPGALSRGAA